MSELNLQTKILTWFRENKRQLPWRGERSWYHIWISEIMLQQTQVETVIPYYKKFIRKFYSVEQLANSSQEEVLKIWEGLGYYSRARNLHRAAKIIVKDYNATLPSSREELLKLPGFGSYTTNAVLSLVFNQPHAVVDGNVKRVLSRFYAIEDDIRNSRTQDKIQKLMDALIPSKYPGEFNEAIMELGATICTSTSPLCSECPISIACLAYKNKLESVLPYKSKRTKIPTTHSLACLIRHQEIFLIVKRPQHKMLAGLWEFPVLNMNNGNTDSNGDISLIRSQFNLETSVRRVWPAIHHSYTHFHLNLHSKLFEASSFDFQSDFYEDYQWLTIKRIRKLPLHKAILKVLTEVEKDLETVS
jgi:A/G-specific adenine glycosylase